MKNYIFGIAAFLLAFAGSLALTHNRWKSIVYVSQAGRGVAAVNSNNDFSHLEGMELASASKERIIESATLEASSEFLAIRLGHFVTRDSSGQKVLACDLFDRVAMTFYASGMAISGEPPKMTIDGPCLADEDANFMRTIELPLRLVFSAGEGTSVSFDELSVKVHFENTGSVWPPSWYLAGVQLYATESHVGPKSEQHDLDGEVSEISLSLSDIQNISERPLRFDVPLQ